MSMIPIDREGEGEGCPQNPSHSQNETQILVLKQDLLTSAIRKHHSGSLPTAHCSSLIAPLGLHAFSGTCTFAHSTLQWDNSCLCSNRSLRYFHVSPARCFWEWPRRKTPNPLPNRRRPRNRPHPHRLRLQHSPRPRRRRSLLRLRPNPRPRSRSPRRSKKAAMPWE